AREFAQSSIRARLLGAAGALAAGVFLVRGVPRLSDFVIARDSPVLPGARHFELMIEGTSPARCELVAGVLTGLGPKWASLRTTSESPSPGETAQITCSIPAPAPGDSIAVRLYDPDAPKWTRGRRIERVTVDGVESLQRRMGSAAGNPTLVIPAQAFEGRPSVSIGVSLEALPDATEEGGRDASFRFEFIRRSGD